MRDIECYGILKEGTSQPCMCYTCSRKEIERLQSRLTEIADAHRVVLEEKCHADERHCACVPVLRHEIERLRGENEKLRERVQQFEDRAKQDLREYKRRYGMD